MADFFPISVWYGENKARAPMLSHPTEESHKIAKRDIENMKKLGFNSVKFWVDWLTVEPEPGVWNLSFIDPLMKLAEKNELKVIMQLYLDSAPNWIASLYPDSRFQAQNDDMIDSQASPGFCLDHPDVRKEATIFMQKVAEQVKKHPSFYGWDVWSEPHILSWTWLDWLPSGVGWFCYCQHSRERFRNWLRKRYDNIRNLNKSWYRAYRDWNEVIPPKYVTLSTWRDLIDWQLFNIDKLAEDLKWRAQTVKKVDSEHVVTSHAAISSVFVPPLNWYGNPDDWEMAKQVEVWGTSLYPKHIGWNNPLDSAQRGISLDATRSSCKDQGIDYWLGELQCGDGVTGIRFGEPVTPQDVQMWAWSAIAREAKGLNYYAWYPMSCGYETSGFGMINLDGSITDRAKAAGEVGRIVTENMDIFRNTKSPKAEIGIVYNIYSYIMLTCSREQSNDIVASSMTGIYRALMEENIPVDFIHINDFVKGNLKNYRLIFMPFSIMMTAEIAEGVKKFVQHGGKLVAEIRPAWSDEKGQSAEVIPGFGLQEVFGCKERWIRERKKTKLLVGSTQEISTFFSEKKEIFGSVYEEAFGQLKDTAKILASFEDGSPAMIINSYGKGEAILIGSLISMTYEKDRNEENGKFLKNLFKWADVEPPMYIKGGNKVEGRILEGSGYKLLFGFNHGDQAELAFHIRIPEEKYKVLDIPSQTEVKWSYENGLRIQRELKSQEVCVLKIEWI
ncbi:MAG: beta-galactosidase [Candidatus Heimdallarchaeota archaeon]|nr:MAG: beta-galactosidase [Candidatus Heimdallarchaeota archaeon]